MTDYQIARLASYESIVKESKANQATIDLIPNFATGIVKLDGICKQIVELKSLQERDISGVFGGKDDRMSALAEHCINHAGAVYSYAQAKNDKVLMALVDYKDSKVGRMGIADLLSVSDIVLKESKKVPPAELAKEGLSADELEDFEDDYTKLKDIKVDPRNAIIDRSAYTKKLKDLFKEANSVKKNVLVRLGTQFRSKDIEFFRKFKSASLVIYQRSAKKVVKPANS